MIKTIINVVGMQVGWFICVLGAANDLPLIGPLFVLIYLFIHLFLVNKPVKEFQLILIISLIGVLIDGFKKSIGFIAYMSAVPAIEWIAPIWIIAMWALFASTLNGSLRWLHRHYFLAFILGALFGPLSYLAGAKLGAISFTKDMTLSIVILAIVWGCVLPLLFWISERIYRVLPKS